MPIYMDIGSVMISRLSNAIPGLLLDYEQPAVILRGKPLKLIWEKALNPGVAQDLMRLESSRTSVGGASRAN